MAGHDYTQDLDYAYSAHSDDYISDAELDDASVADNELVADATLNPETIAEELVDLAIVANASAIEPDIEEGNREIQTSARRLVRHVHTAIPAGSVLRSSAEDMKGAVEKVNYLMKDQVVLTGLRTMVDLMIDCVDILAKLGVQAFNMKGATSCLQTICSKS